MPELPEIKSRAREMQTSLVGRVISDIEVTQPKSLNLTTGEFEAALLGAGITDVTSRGKWIFVETNQGWLLLNLGMGGEILLRDPHHLPEKYRLLFRFQDGDCLVVNFWWFGYAHYAPPAGLEEHAMTAKLGPDALDITREELGEMLAGRRGRIKSTLLDQTRIAGIGNAYVHDILFLARLHPQRQIDTLQQDDIDRLAGAIHAGLQPSLDKGGAFYEVSIYGEPGGFTGDDLLVGYREGKPCPACGSQIVKIKTGSTSSFICPSCQV